MKPLIDKQLIKDGWDAPMRIGVVAAISVLTLASAYGLTIAVQMILLIFAGFDFILTYTAHVIVLSTTFFLTILIQIPIYKTMHRNNYLHYCKSFIVSEFVLIVVFIGLLLYPIL